MAKQAQTPSSLSPTWYKEAIIYQLHVRSFCDSNGDGIGDFRGLISKLDYIQKLGATAVWLLPFFASPLRDDGYDISDYTSIHPMYGSMGDFKKFMVEAKKRHLQVITELVLNHTSDQHCWFQRSRHAKKGSYWRNFYVWSDTPDAYPEARIIFQDFETSNWSWDPVAGAYFWHRFYHHQPDLNFDHPPVRKKLLQTIDSWMELGVDGLRLDAVPYLYEREGTNCENLPETHQFLKEIRRHLDQYYPGKILLAEANQWPEDAANYFGQGDECHMNFHFPLMPRLFMAIDYEDRSPIVDILEQTPPIPENCQWALFLRNHDELTLEMVSDEERHTMYRSYASDPQARINLGIRRRLFPLLKNNRRKVELMHGLLLALPGTPILYYGDEIGMGDNIYLGDRDGMRTPMQWNSDRNGGFSKANPQKLFLPVVIDPAYHYALRNVEVEQSSPYSFLLWMRHIIALRRQFKAFGLGSFMALKAENGQVFCFLREHEEERLLIVANLSRFTQCVELDLSRYQGDKPVEMFGHTSFPPIGALPYFLTIGPHGFYWFRLEKEEGRTAERSADTLPGCLIKKSWKELFEEGGQQQLHKGLASYLQRHRWFSSKARSLKSTELLDLFCLSPPSEGKVPDTKYGEAMSLLLVRTHFTSGEAEDYLLPLLFLQEELAEQTLGDHLSAAIVRTQSVEDGSLGLLCEGTWERACWRRLMELVSQRKTIKGRSGSIKVMQTKAFRSLWKKEYLQKVSPHLGEQSNTSAIFADTFIMKLYRKLSPGVSPDFELSRFLTERAAFSSIPAVAAAIEYQDGTSEVTTIAIVHDFLPHLTDGWNYALAELRHYLQMVQSDGKESRALKIDLEGKRAPFLKAPLQWAMAEPPALAAETMSSFLDKAALLGKQTAELHRALALDKADANFAPESFSKLYQRSLYHGMRSQVRSSLNLLRKQLSKLNKETRAKAEQLLESEPLFFNLLSELLTEKMDGWRIRCHGDYHLGQLLYHGKGFSIIDFDGEPQRPLSERRIKSSPLRDVAGMIRSLHYAAYSALMEEGMANFAQTPEAPSLESWLRFWFSCVSSAFLRGYLEQETGLLPSKKEAVAILLRAYLLEKAFYEVGYELNNRPSWVKIPLEGVLQLVQID